LEGIEREWVGGRVERNGEHWRGIGEKKKKGRDVQKFEERGNGWMEKKMERHPKI
jgi:hypothetical protein